MELKLVFADPLFSPSLPLRGVTYDKSSIPHVTARSQKPLWFFLIWPVLSIFFWTPLTACNVLGTMGPKGFRISRKFLSSCVCLGCGVGSVFQKTLNRVINLNCRLSDFWTGRGPWDPLIHLAHTNEKTETQRSQIHRAGGRQLSGWTQTCLLPGPQVPSRALPLKEANQESWAIPERWDGEKPRGALGGDSHWGRLCWGPVCQSY